jgi:hypothetical protein
VLFERSIFTVAVLAALAFVAAGVDAFLTPSIDAALGHHVLLTLGAALLVVFPHLWTVLYLVTTSRAVRIEVEEKRASPRVLSRTARNRRRALPPALLTALAAMGTVMLGQQALVGPQPWVHAAAFFLCLVLQGWALWAEHRSLWDNAALLAELDARPPAANAEPAPARP